MKNFDDFIRECYLASEPSVDLNDVTSDNPVNCSNHRLSCEKYNELIQACVQAYEGKESEERVREACNMWCLMSGPKLYEKQ